MYFISLYLRIRTYVCIYLRNIKVIHNMEEHFTDVMYIIVHTVYEHWWCIFRYVVPNYTYAYWYKYNTFYSDWIWIDIFYFDSVQKHICAIIPIDKCVCSENFILFQLKMYSYMTLYERVNKYLYKICTMNYVTSTFLCINFVLLQMNFYIMATFVRFVFGLQESALT